jgi:hypothetical protein
MNMTADKTYKAILIHLSGSRNLESGRLMWLIKTAFGLEWGETKRIIREKIEDQEQRVCRIAE